MTIGHLKVVSCIFWLQNIVKIHETAFKIGYINELEIGLKSNYLIYL